MACSDCNQACNCRIVGTGSVTVTGSGLANDPYVITSAGPVSPMWTPATTETWSTSTVDLSDLDEPTTIEVSLTANVTTLTLPTWFSTVSGDITILLTNTGAFSVTWPGLEAGGTPTGTTSGAGARDLFQMKWTGTQWVTRRLAANVS